MLNVTTNKPINGKTLFDLLIEWDDYATEIDDVFFVRYSGGVDEDAKDPEDIAVSFFIYEEDETVSFNKKSLDEAKFNFSKGIWLAKDTEGNERNLKFYELLSFG